MKRTNSNTRKLGATLLAAALCVIAVLQPQAASALGVTLAWDPSPDSQVVGYNVYYGASSGQYTNSISVGNVTLAGVSGLVEGVTYYFAATAYDSTGLESEPSNEVSYTVPISAVNQPPTLDPLADVMIDENAGPQTVSLTGVTSGAANESQTLQISATSSNPMLIPTPGVSYTSPASTGILTFTPSPSEYGTAVITVTVSDGQAQNNTFTRSFTITVNPVNQAPTLAALADLVIEENAGVQTISLTGISSGAANENQALQITATSSNPTLIPTPGVSYISPASTGLLTFKPSSNEYGTAVITVTVSDGQTQSSSVSRAFTVTVNPVNQAPTLDALADLVIEENAGAQTVSLTGITSGAVNENQPLQVSASSSNPTLIPTPGVSYTSPASTGILTFKPSSNEYGTAVITVTISDGQPQSSSISRAFTVTVNPVNQAPTLDALANVALDENAGAQTVSLTGITSGAANETQTLQVTATSSNPTLIPTPGVSYTSPASTGILTFTPSSNEYGTAVITVTVSDGQAQNSSVSRAFTVTVGPVNQAPTLDVLADLVIEENAGAQTVSLTGITSGAASETQTLQVTASSSNPTLIPTPSVSYTSPASTGILTFTPSSNEYGTAVITVTVSDGQAQNSTTSRSLTVTVNPVNQAPTLDALADLLIEENAGVQTVSLTGISSGAANESQTLQVTATSSNPTLIPTPGMSYTSPASTGLLTFKPSSNENGTAVITVTISDGQTQSSTTSRSFTVTVNPVNQAPTLTALADLVIEENAGAQTVSLTGISSGAANESQTLQVTATSSNPTLIPTPSVSYTSPASTGILTFKPSSNENGTAVITVTVSDGHAQNNSVSRAFTVTVGPVNQAPTLDALTDLVIEENAGAQTVSLTGITSGAANETQTLQITATSSNPALIPTPGVSYGSPNATGLLTFKPSASEYGTAVITVTVSDGQAQSSTTSRSFTVTVNPVNQPPTLDALADLVILENAGAQTVSLAGISSGAANESQTLQVTATSSNPTLIPTPGVSYTSPASTGILTFTPSSNEYGTAVITVTVSDGQTQSSTTSRSFTVTVNPANRPPTLNALADVVIEENAGSQTVSLTGITSGSANENQTLQITASSSNPALIPTPGVSYTSPASTGLLTFKPSSNENGTAVITVTVSDGQTLNSTTTRSFTVTVNPVNQAPTLNAVADLAILENAGAQTVSLTGISSGAANENQTLQITASSSNPALIPTPGVSYTSPASTGLLTFKPSSNENGTAVITVTVSDGQTQNNTFSRSFTVTVNPVNRPPTLNALADLVIEENGGAQTVSLTGITSGAVNENQALQVTATSSNPTLIPTPSVSYTSPASIGLLTFKPSSNENGTAVITVTVSDGQTQNSTTTRSFTVTVNPVNQAPTLNALADLVILENASAQTVSLTGISSGAANESQTLQISATSSNPSLIRTPSVSYSSPSASGSLTFQPATNQFGTAVITVTVTDGDTQNNAVSRSFMVQVNALNRPPSLDVLSPVVIDESAGLQTVTLTGISSGAAHEIQTLTVSASSSNPALIPTPTVSYTSPGVSGSLSFTPAAYQYGTAVITVTVNDGQGQNSSVSRSFTVTVNPVNQAPTLGALNDLALAENASTQTVSLTGISTGAANENQTLKVIASSSNPTLLPAPTVSYASPNSAGSLTLKPALNQFGTAVITVTVDDGQAQNSTFTRSFTVQVTALNRPPTLDALGGVVINENAGEQTLSLSGISSGRTEEDQVLQVTAKSSNPALIPTPVVNYISPATTATLTFKPAANQYGSAVITVTINDGQSQNSTINRSFTVTVKPVNQPPTLDALSDLQIEEDSGIRTVNLTGITSGPANEKQVLKVSATSSNPALIPTPMVNYLNSSETGTLVFRPAVGRVGRAVITVTVNDGQTTDNTVHRSFTVTIVGKKAEVRIGSTMLAPGQRGSVPLSLESTVGIINLDCLVEVPEGTLSDLKLESLAQELNVTAAKVMPMRSNAWWVHLESAPGRVLSGSKSLGRLVFTTSINRRSALVPVRLAQIQTIQADGSAVLRHATKSGRVAIVGDDPLLEASQDAVGSRLTLYGKIGSEYAVETCVGPGQSWVPVLAPFRATSVATAIGALGPSNSVMFFRAVELDGEQANE